MDPTRITALQKKLKNRGFRVEGMREHCPKCDASTVMLWVIAGRIGGRDIEWCMACDTIKSYRRTAADQRTEEENFDIDTFLA
jgi:hypothetical protein